MARRKRSNYSPADREVHIKGWEDAGRPPRGRYANEHNLTPSMFNRWLQLAGKIPIPEGGMTGGTPQHLKTVSQQKRSGKGRVRHRRTDAYIRGVLNDCYGSTPLPIGEVVRKHKCAVSQPSEWKKKRPELMPGGTSVVRDPEPLLRLGSGDPPAPPNGHSPNGLQLEMGGQEQAAAALFDQSQSDAWTELMSQLEPLPPRSRLRVLTLIEKIQA